jgi:hypothetical protein
MIPRDHYPMYNLEDLPTLQVFELQTELDFHPNRHVSREKVGYVERLIALVVTVGFSSCWPLGC